jgi:ATP11 protein
MQSAGRLSVLCRLLSSTRGLRGCSQYCETQIPILRGSGTTPCISSRPCYQIRQLASVQAPRMSGHGFSYPGPRELKDIVKLPLLNAHGAHRVREIWTEFHHDHKAAIADVLTGDEFGTLMQRSQRCPFFVLPVSRYVEIDRARNFQPLDEHSRLLTKPREVVP